MEDFGFGGILDAMFGSWIVGAPPLASSAAAPHLARSSDELEATDCADSSNAVLLQITSSRFCSTQGGCRRWVGTASSRHVEAVRRAEQTGH